MPLSNRKFWLLSWFGFFAYSALASAFIQLILLPYVLPAWHGGHGLMKGHDWITYHAIGAEISEFIRRGEWQNWWNANAIWIEPRVISLFYGLVKPEPWTLIPLNAFFHATAALFLAFVFLSFVSNNRKAALLGALPFLLYPSALLWVSQIHKDGATNFAFACYLLGWVLLFRLKDALTFSRLLGILALIAFGSWFAWYLRPYLGLTLTVTSVAFIFVGTCIAIFHLKQEKKFAFGLVASSLVVMGLYPWLGVNCYQGLNVPTHQIIIASDGSRIGEVKQSREKEKKVKVTKKKAADVVPTGVTQAPVVAAAPESVATPASEDVGPEAPAIPTVSNDMASLMEEPTTAVVPEEPHPLVVNLEDVWHDSNFFPAFIEVKAYALARVRNGFVNTMLGKSNIDRTVRFHETWDVIRYLPRAFQVGLLMPFPKDWLNQGSTEYNSFFKKVTVLETLLVYLMLPFFFVCVFRGKREGIVVFLLTALVLVLFGTTVANLGTLYRFRYFFITSWTGLGLSYAYAQRNALRSFKKIKLFKLAPTA